MGKTTLSRGIEPSGSAVGIKVFLGQLGGEDIPGEDGSEEKEK